MSVSRKPRRQPSQEMIREIAEGVGYILIAASHLEHMLGLALAKLLRLSKLQHRALIIPMSTRSKTTIIRQIGNEYLRSDQKAALKKYLKAVENCADQRNDLAHGFYGAKKGKFDLITFSGEGRFAGRPTSWSAKSLGQLRDNILAVRDQIPLVFSMFPTRLKLPKSLRRSDPSP